MPLDISGESTKGKKVSKFACKTVGFTRGDHDEQKVFPKTLNLNPQKCSS